MEKNETWLFTKPKYEGFHFPPPAGGIEGGGQGDKTDSIPSINWVFLDNRKTKLYQTSVKQAAVKQNRLIPRSHILFAVTILVLIVQPFILGAAEKKNKETEHQKLLKRTANRSLAQLKHAIKSEGFFYARSALNIWRSTAMDAGTFDEEQYNTFKKQIYQKSINSNLQWFELFINQKNYHDARICLELWRVHATEMGVFEEEQYNKLKQRLSKAIKD